MSRLAPTAPPAPGAPAAGRGPGVADGRGLPTVLEQLRERTRPVAGAVRVLPVRDDLAALLPDGGLRRGTVVEVGSPALCFALLGRAAAAGSWVALVGAPDAGLAATIDHGLGLERLAVVSAPPAAVAATVVAALLDAVELVVVGAGVPLGPSDARRLAARARERGAVVLTLAAWPVAADLHLVVDRHHWSGVAQGHGVLQGWSVEVTSSGRGAAARARRAWLPLVGPDPLALPFDAGVDAGVDAAAADAGVDAGVDAAAADAAAPSVVPRAG